MTMKVTVSTPTATQEHEGEGLLDIPVVGDKLALAEQFADLARFFLMSHDKLVGAQVTILLKRERKRPS
jgi:hypothetical protein